MADHHDQALQPDKNAILGALTTFVHPWAQLNWSYMLELRCLSENGTPDIQHFTIDELTKAAGYASDTNRMKKNIYFCPNPIAANLGKPATDADVVAATWCFADADTPHSAQAIINYQGLAPDFLVTTGTVPNPRFHAYWSLEEPVYDLLDWRQVQKGIAGGLGTDPAVVNPSRIMRLPYTVSWPSEKKRARGYVPELVTINPHPQVGRN